MIVSVPDLVKINFKNLIKFMNAGKIKLKRVRSNSRRKSKTESMLQEKCSFINQFKMCYYIFCDEKFKNPFLP